ncbi:MAG: transposase, partial [Gammaproteobacteria bacterium]
MAPHIECTLERARPHLVVLAIQDTSELDDTGKSAIVGLGPLTYASQHGLHIHPTLMVTPERVPLGVFDAWNWARDPEDFGTDQRQRSIEEKERIRWLEGYRRVCEAQAELPETRLVYVADRESDIYELFAQAETCARPRAELLIRANQDRCLTDGQKLWEAAAAAPVLGEII